MKNKELTPQNKSFKEVNNNVRKSSFSRTFDFLFLTDYEEDSND